MKTRGGKRKGAGRPPLPTVRLRVTIKTSTASLLEREAKRIGLVRRPGAPPYLGGAVDSLAARAKSEKPEFLQLAEELKQSRNPQSP